MPTPVSTARQCLTDEAARALDDAVAVARRRSHTQTTSLHAVSALLSLSPISPLRAAFLRAPRLQLRALELSVGVSLDRLPTSRTAADGPPPPVANSLMAAIKRSQANQRRHPDTWQLYQSLQGASQSANSVIRVEMKHFILSILDDPIVSRVMGEAGFRSSEIKLSVLHPPNLGKLPIYPPMMFNFPFCFDTIDDNCKRIREILVKRKGNKRNPLLIGAFANEALTNFTNRVRKGEAGVGELEGVSVISFGNEGLEGNFQELRGMLVNSCGGRVLVSVGDFRGLIGRVVSELGELMSVFGERLWVIGAVGSYDIYMKVLGKFPSMEKDWDLQVLPIASSTSSPGLSSKSSLMGSFVPLGGFFPSPSEFSSQLSYTTQSAPIISNVLTAKSITENPQVSPSSVTSVTTDLGLGTIFVPKEPEKHKFEDHKGRLLCFPRAVATKPDEFVKNGSNCVAYPPQDARDFKSMCRLINEKIGRQSEAISTICQAISRCKAGLGKPRGSSRRGDIWLNFIGHDKVGKKRVALALAEMIFGSKGTVISVDLTFENGGRCSNSIFRGQNINTFDGKCRGKTGVDCIVDELSKNPHSVVLLENIEKADYLTQNSMLDAIRTGRLANSHGKEISITNAIFVTTSNICNKSLYKQDVVRFSEERILDAKNWRMQILVRSVDDYTKKTDGTNVLIVNTNKRKLIDMNDSTLDESKRAKRGPNLMLDLNLPVEEGEDIDDKTCGSDSDSENSKAWLEEFVDQVDENVVFQPFDFNTTSNEVFRDISLRFRMTVGSDAVLEIDDEVAVQVIAAAWLSDKGTIKNWVEHVLGQSFVEAKERCNNLGRVIMKLVACEGVDFEEQPLGVCLPARITIN